MLVRQMALKAVALRRGRAAEESTSHR